jgi:hypothetical protein
VPKPVRDLRTMLGIDPEKPDGLVTTDQIAALKTADPLCMCTLVLTHSPLAMLYATIAAVHLHARYVACDMFAYTWC